MHINFVVVVELVSDIHSWLQQQWVKCITHRDRSSLVLQRIVQDNDVYI